MPVYQEEYNTGLVAEGGIAREVERYTHELDCFISLDESHEIHPAALLPDQLCCPATSWTPESPCLLGPPATHLLTP